MLDTAMKILVVDDSAFMRRIIRNHLRMMNLENVKEASDGREALSLLKKENFDLILSDISMRGMNGIKFLKAVRADDGTKDIPFIMITAEAQPHIIYEAVQAKVDEYITKPFTPNILRENIVKVLRLAREAY